MNLSSFLGKNIDSVFEELKTSNDVISYKKIEYDSFIECYELGFYLHSRNIAGVITDIRIFLKEFGEYFPIDSMYLGELQNVRTLSQLESQDAEFIREIPAIHIPGAQPTLWGKQYRWKEFLITAYSMNKSDIEYVHIKKP